MGEEPQALIFDVFGTLVDWRTGVAREVAAALSPITDKIDPCAFADEWRGQYQPAMERIRSGGRGYVPLDILHLENLEFVLERHGLSDRLDMAAKAELNRAWEKLPPWPDTVPGLTRLKSRFFIAPCSNGSIALMVRLARFAQLPWDTVLGADIAGEYKPQKEVYLASASALGLSPGQVMMVAAHNDDLHAAREAGLQTAFLPRPLEFGDGGYTESGPTGDWEIVARDISDLAARLVP